jgi:periplasmic divalent cation tolerance protein
VALGKDEDPVETEFVQVTSTVDREDIASLLVKRVVRERLAACGRVSGPVVSVYWWKDGLHREEEYVMVFKTTTTSAQKLVEYLKKNHTYENPEIVVTPITGGSPEYLDWLRGETRG